MPPVFGPVSPSASRLWSWLDASASACCAVGHHDEARLLAVEEFLDDHARACRCRAVGAASRRSAACAVRSSASLTTTPLPGGEAVGLDDDRRAARRRRRRARAAASGERRVCRWSVSDAAAMKALAKSFELSSRAAARVGPKIHRRPAAVNASTMPARQQALRTDDRVSATASLGANATSAAISPIGTFVSSGSAAVYRRCQVRRTPSRRAATARPSTRARARDRRRRRPGPSPACPWSSSVQRPDCTACCRG